MTTAPAPRAGCPVQLTTFIGREREIAAVDDLLQSTRLVTLTGVGGAGKTRLAAEVAARVTPRFEASAWVDLASLSDPALAATRSATSAGLSRRGGPVSGPDHGAPVVRVRDLPHLRQLRAPGRRLCRSRGDPAQGLPERPHPRHEPRSAGRAGRASVAGAAALAARRYHRRGGPELRSRQAVSRARPRGASCFLTR